MALHWHNKNSCPAVLISSIKYMFVKASISADPPFRLPINAFYNNV